MKSSLTILLIFLLFTSCMESVQNTESAETVLEELLDKFLQGASINDEQMHDRFWAEDLIYTSSAGERLGKEDIMAGFEDENEEIQSDEPGMEYGYEDLQIMVFDDTAIVAFRLVGTAGTGEEREVVHFYNTGTFLNRENEWRAVAWQATRIP